MAYNNTSHGSLHALFEASFQKLNDAVSSDPSTVSHKAHCDRVEKHLVSGLANLGAGDQPADEDFLLSLDNAKMDTIRLLDYDIVIFSRDFLKTRCKDSVKFEHLCHTNVALGLPEAWKISSGNAQRPNLFLHSDYYSQTN
ncbi:hypothetical protein F52700_13466 [Fusarium sp. NRRL 52700]|nr:hypothetical protein F52700_13466 [Fusarium sp. NRRL 52700]